MGTMAYQITNLTIVYFNIYSGTDQRKHQCPASLAFGNSLVTAEFPAQRSSNAKNVSIWWRHMMFYPFPYTVPEIKFSNSDTKLSW